VDAILFSHNINNNFRHALKGMQDDRAAGLEPREVPTLVYANIDALGALEHGLRGSSRQLHAFLNYSVANYSLSICKDHRLADVVWVCDKVTMFEDLAAFRQFRSDFVIYTVAFKNGKPFLKKTT
jgi:hypothetical protein